MAHDFEFPSGLQDFEYYSASLLTLYSAHSRVGRGNLVLRHSVPLIPFANISVFGNHTEGTRNVITVNQLYNKKHKNKPIQLFKKQKNPKTIQLKNPNIVIWTNSETITVKYKTCSNTVVQKSTALTSDVHTSAKYTLFIFAELPIVDN